VGVEIERKFLVDKSKWEKVKPAQGTSIVQGYITKEINRTVRVRIRAQQGFLTVKGKTIGAERAEFEYEIPLSEAREMLNTLCDKLIDKIRYEVVYAGKTWEVDEFYSPNKGLILAEVELIKADEAIKLPSWITEEVTEDPAYYNANMV
jgi:CYTH domain-containing protein